MENFKYNNILIRRKKIEWIAYNYQLSTHAKVQITKRCYEDLQDEDFKNLILESPLAWKSKDKQCICIALNLFDYIVVNPDTTDEKTGQKYANILTYVSTRNNDQTVIDKFLMDYKQSSINEQTTQKYWVVRANLFWYKFEQLEKAEAHYNYIFNNLEYKYKNVNKLYLAEYNGNDQPKIIKIWKRER